MLYLLMTLQPLKYPHCQRGQLQVGNFARAVRPQRSQRTTLFVTAVGYGKSHSSNQIWRHIICSHTHTFNWQHAYLRTKVFIVYFCPWSLIDSPDPTLASKFRWWIIGLIIGQLIVLRRRWRDRKWESFPLEYLLLRGVARLVDWSI